MDLKAVAMSGTNSRLSDKERTMPVKAILSSEMRIGKLFRIFLHQLRVDIHHN